MADKFTVGLVQMRCTSNKEENLGRAEGKIREAAARGAQIICLHELFAGEYFCRTEDAALFALAEAVPGPTTERLARVAKEKKVALVVSVFERRAAGVYHNTCAILDADGAYLGKYRKMHIPDDPLYYEKFYFTPGDLGFLNFDTKYARIGVQICWDQWYPEGSRITAMRGAQVIFYPTSIGWHPHEKGGVWRGATGCMEDDTTGACGSEWDLCGGGESRGIRGEAGEGRRGAGVLGKFVRGGSVWGGGGGGFAGEGRNPGGGVRSGEERGDAEELAIF